MRRVVVIGTSGCGKTTLAQQLAKLLDVPHIELDELHWDRDWTATPTDRFRAKVQAAIDVAPSGWTVCGNYRPVRDLIWPNADTIIWLDYSMRTIFTRAFVRTVSRWWRRETLWNDNRETLWINFCTKDSLLLWVITTWRQRRNEYGTLLKTPLCRHMRALRFRTPQQMDAWLREVRSNCDAEHQ